MAVAPDPASPATEGAPVAFAAARSGAGDTPQPRPPGLDADVALPPAWAFGVLYGNYCDQAELERRVAALRADGCPVDAMWADSSFWDLSTHGPAGYINFRGDAQAFPDVAGLCQRLGQLGIRFGVWMWDRISAAEREVYAAFEACDGFAGPPITDNAWHNRGLRAPSRLVAFERPAAAALWRERMAPLVAAGVAFYKLDAGPAEAYVRTHFELSQQAHTRGPKTLGRGFVLSHVGRPHLPAIKRYPGAWTGDSLPAWHHREFPDPIQWVWGGLQEQLRMVADPLFGYAAYPFLANDTGGFRNLPGHGRASDELYQRWVQFSAFGSLMEVFGSGSFPLQNQPQAFSADALATFRRYTQLRLRLFPYLYTYAHLTRLAGRKIVEGDARHPTQFLFGRELLVAPVYESGATTRTVWLPENNHWHDYWTGEIHAGGRPVTVPAPVDRLPLFVRAGAIIPLRDFAPAVTLGTNARLTLRIHPAGTSSFTLIEDDGVSNSYLQRGFATTTLRCEAAADRVTFWIEPMQGTFTGALTERTWSLEFHLPAPPVRASLDPTSLPIAWDERHRTATVELTRATREPTRLTLTLPPA